MEQGIRLPNPKADLEYQGPYIFQYTLGEQGQTFFSSFGIANHYA